MKKILSLIVLLSIVQSAYADSWNRLETYQDAYDRQSQRNYETYRNNNYQAPLGGYSQGLNEPSGYQYGYNFNNRDISSPYSNNNSFNNNYSNRGF